MANEIGISIGITHSKAPNIPFSVSRQLDQTGEGVFAQPVDVGTTAETLAFPDITTPHVVVLWNLDSSNFVSFGIDDAGVQKTIGRLRPGQQLPAIIPWEPGALLSMQADTAPCKVHVQVYEE